MTQEITEEEELAANAPEDDDLGEDADGFPADETDTAKTDIELIRDVGDPEIVLDDGLQPIKEPEAEIGEEVL